MKPKSPKQENLTENNNSFGKYIYIGHQSSRGQFYNWQCIQNIWAVYFFNKSAHAINQIGILSVIWYQHGWLHFFCF